MAGDLRECMSSFFSLRPVNGDVREREKAKKSKSKNKNERDCVRSKAFDCMTRFDYESLKENWKRNSTESNSN